MNRQASFYLAGARPPVAALGGPAGDRGGHHRHAGAVDGDVELVRRIAVLTRCRQHGQRPACDRSRLGGDALGRGSAVGLGGAFNPFVRQLDSGQLGEQVGGSGERLGGCGAGHHTAQTRRQGRVGDAKIVVAGHDPTPAGSAVVVGTAQRYTPQHGIDVLVAVTDELRGMSADLGTLAIRCGSDGSDNAGAGCGGKWSPPPRSGPGRRQRCPAAAGVAPDP